jgi:hypothetical protein
MAIGCAVTCHRKFRQRELESGSPGTEAEGPLENALSILRAIQQFGQGIQSPRPARSKDAASRHSSVFGSYHPKASPGGSATNSSSKI